MAYVVLARKYRPQRFADLVGQEHVTRTLANAIAHNRVHHAYLFCGGRGLGKTTAARLLAKCLVCVKGPTIDPCNVCNECTAVTEGRSVDVIEIDGASNNRVEDVRNLRDQVRYLPQTARRKIYIIDEVHMLTGSAFNALLKTLEEPPEHVTFIFATTEVHELPATILSRVSRFDFRRVSSAHLVAHLQRILSSEGVSVEEAGLYTIARAGDGSVRDSLTLLDKVIAFASDTNKVSADEVRVVLGVPGALAVAGLVEAVLARDPTLTLRRFDEVFASGQDLLALALEFLKHLRDLTIVKLCGTRDVLVDASDAEFEQLTTQAAGVDSLVLSQLFDRFTRVVDALPRTRVPRLVLEMGLLDLVHGEPLIPLGDLIDRLEQISTGAPGGGGGTPRAVSPTTRSTASPALARPPSDPRTRAEPPTTGRPSADSSPFSKILAGAGLVGQDLAAVPSPTPAVHRPRPADHAPERAPAGEPPPWDEASWGPEEPQVASERRRQAAVSPPNLTERHRDELPKAAACDTGCPGSPQPEADGILQWTKLPQLAAWEQFLGRLQIHDEGPLFAILAELGLVKLGDGLLRLAGTAVAFARNHLRDQAPLRAHLESLLQQHLGSPFKLELIEGEPSLPDLPSLTLIEARRREELQSEVEREADANPQILALKAQFAAQVRSVRPRVTPSRSG
ncbi:MAG: DNA polymerase III subunit gamma/tau [Nannocystis sp.]|uniref:DNA polymerase III subunit gamma/tau n=1 Tax=Nannocystis sp. TaxID=1962667 RepID=UPI002420EB4D|nr:DNA polymerase III subunit gamma/tau [Nannocystis sp.]MBK9753037.1 DNA polymerase III subunit gamma/tau [Nannocystis sp.]